MASDEQDPVREPSDAELIAAVRAGEMDQFDPLYKRHVGAANWLARQMTRTVMHADDLVAEAFTRVLYAVRSGQGPTESFRPYLLTTLRHLAYDWSRTERREFLTDDLAVYAPADTPEDPVIAALERSLAGQAFTLLPERWQLVLWHTEVEGETPSQVALLLGVEPGAVAALAYRAREGLKQAYLQAHITQLGSESCRPIVAQLGAETRGRIGKRNARMVREHLEHCADCQSMSAMLKYVNGHIGAVVAPAVLGKAAAARAVADSLTSGKRRPGAGRVFRWLRPRDTAEGTLPARRQ